jgi:hypothetical protein
MEYSFTVWAVVVSGIRKINAWKKVLIDESCLIKKSEIS